MTYAGAEAYKVIWKPLLVGKFAKFSEDVPAAWLRERIRDRSFDLGYLDGGSETLLMLLLANLRNIRC